MYYFLAHKLLSLGGNKDRLKTIADHTFILALDGDVDFQPAALKLLVDRMKRNPNVGAACGRIHPIGSGKTNLNIIVSFLNYASQIIRLFNYCVIYRTIENF